MSKTVYCAQCGMKLNTMRKALPTYGRIIDLVEQHECSEEPVELDLTPVDVPSFTPAFMGKDQFVQNLNQLDKKARLGPLGTEDLRDRRDAVDIKSDVSSTAPQNLIEQVKQSIPTDPARDLGEDPRDV